MLTKLNSLKVNRFRSDEEGFTLIELLVVILIIGILAAVALPTFLNQGKKGADAAAQSDLQSISTKIEACATQTNSYSSCVTAGTGTKGSDSDAPQLPATMVASAVTAGGYTLRVSNPKGKNAWKMTSDGNATTAPATDGAAGS